MNSREEWNSILSGCAICCWIFAQEMLQFAHSHSGLFWKKKESKSGWISGPGPGPNNIVSALPLHRHCVQAERPTCWAVKDVSFDSSVRHWSGGTPRYADGQLPKPPYRWTMPEYQGAKGWIRIHSFCPVFKGVHGWLTLTACAF